MDEITVYKIFCTPLIHLKFLKHDQYNFVNQNKTVIKPKGWSIDLNTSFPNISDDDLFINKDIKDALKNDLLECIRKSLEALNLPKNIFFLNFWYNIYHDNQGQELHWHMPNVGEVVPYWCGIYYNKNSSPTIFYKDKGASICHSFEGYENSKINDCNFGHFYPHVKDGDILLFPPYLLHSVYSEEKHQHDMRLTFSFNLGLNNAR